MPRDKQRSGRPRDSRVDRAVVNATRDVLAEIGYARLTVDVVAARAGTGKAAIYRRYASKQEMVFAAAVHDLSIEIPPDAGSLAADLVALIDDILATMSGPTAFAAVPGLLADLTTDSAVSARFQETFMARERACVTAVLDRAVLRGELNGRPDVDMVHALLIGPVFAWLFLLHKPERHIFARDLGACLAAAIGSVGERGGS